MGAGQGGPAQSPHVCLRTRALSWTAWGPHQGRGPLPRAPLKPKQIDSAPGLDADGILAGSYEENLLKNSINKELTEFRNEKQEKGR